MDATIRTETVPSHVEESSGSVQQFAPSSGAIATTRSGLEALNTMCPYYTMFPLDFPLRHLEALPPGSWVYDPFCGRGTTALAARMLGQPSVSADVSPVAVMITRAKLASASPGQILELAETLLREVPSTAPPDGPFWQIAYHPDTLGNLWRLRQGLLHRPGDAAAALRGIVLGALHGPIRRTKDSYFSNQMPRTFAPKPNYAVRFWTAHGLKPRCVDVLGVISERAHRYYSHNAGPACGEAQLADARQSIVNGRVFAATITSPPYFGMNTYVPDQWLRHWFVGGPSTLDYAKGCQLAQGTLGTFIDGLAAVWATVGRQSRPGAMLVVRFGSLPSRPIDPRVVITASLERSEVPWAIEAVEDAGRADHGQRQAAQMGNPSRQPAREEIDVVCRRLPNGGPVHA